MALIHDNTSAVDRLAVFVQEPVIRLVGQVLVARRDPFHVCTRLLIPALAIESAQRPAQDVSSGFVGASMGPDQLVVLCRGTKSNGTNSGHTASVQQLLNAGGSSEAAGGQRQRRPTSVPTRPRAHHPATRSAPTPRRRRLPSPPAAGTPRHPEPRTRAPRSRHPHERAVRRSATAGRPLSGDVWTPSQDQPLYSLPHSQDPAFPAESVEHAERRVRPALRAGPHLLLQRLPRLVLRHPNRPLPRVPAVTPVHGKQAGAAQPSLD